MCIYVLWNNLYFPFCALLHKAKGFAFILAVSCAVVFFVSHVEVHSVFF